MNLLLICALLVITSLANTAQAAEDPSPPPPTNASYMVPSQSGFAHDFGSREPGVALMVQVGLDSGCVWRNNEVAGGQPVWQKTGEFVATGTMPEQPAGRHDGQFTGEWRRASNGGEGEGEGAGEVVWLPWDGAALAQRCEFRRTDNPDTDPDPWEWSPRWTQGYVWQGRSDSGRHTFDLKYNPGDDDCCDGAWRHRYVLQSSGDMTVGAKPNLSLFGNHVGGVLFAVGMVLEVDGEAVFQRGAAADSRPSEPSSDLDVTLNFGVVAIDLSPITFPGPVAEDSVASDSFSMAKDIMVDVDEASPEKKALSHKKRVLVRTKSQVVYTPGHPGTPRRSGSAGIKFEWEDSSVLSSHFHDQ